MTIEHLSGPSYITQTDSSFANNVAEENFALLATQLGVSSDQIRSVRQVHGSRVVSDKEWYAGIEADALISTDPSIIIGVKVADCCPIFLWTEDLFVISVVHSGWRGTAANILQLTVDRLTSEYGVDVRGLHVHLGPCASGRFYEVGNDVHDALADYCQPHPSLPNKWLFDNHQALSAQARTAGVLHITTTSTCTMEDKRYHSYRRDGAASGRCFAFMKR